MHDRARLDRRHLLAAGTALVAAGAVGGWAPARRKPNIVIVLCDDLGYGDLGVTGSALIRTPNIDKLAQGGARLTDFYASANVCTPSRAGLLTGRYPIRTGLAKEVIQAGDKRGLPLSEVTIPQALRPEYATALVGKWHLGHVEPYWPPTRHGFDQFFGLPYSHDMQPLGLFTAGPDGQVTREDVDFPRLTERFFERGLAFIEANKDRPFFLQLALSAPHLPLIPHPDHAGKSKAAAYGDVVEEVDTGVGRLMARLRALGIERDTLVIFTSDNGPWFEGSAGPLRDRKGGAGWDGGYRVPFLAHWPGVIPAGLTSRSIAMNIDLFPTIMAAAGKPLPAGVELDGRDLTPVLTRKGAPSPHDELVLFNNEQVAAIRTQRWKLVGRSYYRHLDLALDKRNYLTLYDVAADPSEVYNLASLHPDVVADLTARFRRAQATFEPLAAKPA